MNFEIMLIILLLVSLFTGLATEAIKILLDEFNRNYYSNLLAGCCSVVISVIVSIGYMILTESAFTDKMAVYLIALIFLSWLSSMLGYDKVMQAITQFKSGSYTEEE